MNVRIKDMTWPLPDGDIEWCLRYGEPGIKERLRAASILSAYSQMIFDPREKRQMVIREIRKEMKKREAL